MKKSLVKHLGNKFPFKERLTTRAIKMCEPTVYS